MGYKRVGNCLRRKSGIRLVSTTIPDEEFVLTTTDARTDAKLSRALSIAAKKHQTQLVTRNLRQDQSRFSTLLLTWRRIDRSSRSRSRLGPLFRLHCRHCHNGDNKILQNPSASIWFSYHASRSQHLIHDISTFGG